MKFENYSKKLFKENKYCECENLVKFSTFGKEKENLEEKCNDLTESLLGIHQGSREVYNLREKKRREVVGLYSEGRKELNSLIKEGKINLFYHDENKNYRKKKIDFEKGLKILKDDKKIVTANCDGCKQQIAVLSIK